MAWIRSNKIFAVIMLVSFLASLAYSFAYRIQPAVDAAAYDQIAVNLISGKGFKEDAAKSFEFDTSIVRAGPGYEFFLASIYVVFGHRYDAVWVVQAALHAVSALLIYYACKRLFNENGKTIGLFSSALFGFHPDLIEISAMLMTETLYLFCIIISVYLFVIGFQQSKSLSIAGLLGFVVGLAILTRPPVMLFIPVILWMYAWSKSYRSAGIFLIASVLTIAPWTVRNFLIYHQFIPTTLIGSYNLWIGNRLGADGGQIAGGFNPLTAYTDVHGFLGLKKRAAQEFFSFILTYPLEFIKLCFLRVIRYSSLIRPMGFWFYQTGIKQLLFVSSSLLAIAVVFVSGFSGMVQAFKERQPIFYYLIIFAIISPLVLIPTVVQSRYRFQIYPFLSIFGGYWIWAMIKKVPAAAWSVKRVLSVLIIISLIDIAIFWPTIVGRLRIF